MLKISVICALLIAGTALERAGNPDLAFNTMEQEFSEDDALERFEIDELFLPKLNLDLPELFDWSDIDSAYYAHSAPAYASHEAGARRLLDCLC
jgi:hypothetical protein